MVKQRWSITRSKRIYFVSPWENLKIGLNDYLGWNFAQTHMTPLEIVYGCPPLPISQYETGTSMVGEIDGL